MDIKDKIIKAIGNAWAQENLSDPSSTGEMGNLKSQFKKETAEATGSAGAFEPMFSGEMKEKWSEKYKKSIDCNNPRGFSQRAHCQGRKKTETKEATTSASSGQYSSTAFGAKSMKPKDWRGASKTQIPGGTFVQVKKKCKNFPYCNQGDINALKLTKSPVVRKKAKKLAEQYGVSEDLIIKLVLEDIYKKTF